jgi:hypothetical protein
MISKKSDDCIDTRHKIKSGRGIDLVLKRSANRAGTEFNLFMGRWWCCLPAPMKRSQGKRLIPLVASLHKRHAVRFSSDMSCRTGIATNFLDLRRVGWAAMAPSGLCLAAQRKENGASYSGIATRNCRRRRISALDKSRSLPC